MISPSPSLPSSFSYLSAGPRRGAPTGRANYLKDLAQRPTPSAVPAGGAVPLNREGRHKQVEQHDVVIGGVDTHKDLHVAAVLDSAGRLLGTASFANPAGSQHRMVRSGPWSASKAPAARRWSRPAPRGGRGRGREGIGRTDRCDDPRRRHIDAEAAARAALNGQATAAPKAAMGSSSRSGCCASRPFGPFHQGEISGPRPRGGAPDGLRAVMEPLETAQRRAPPGTVADPTEATRAATLPAPALTGELDVLRAQLDELTVQANPALREGRRGRGIDPLIAAGDNPQRLRSPSAMCGAPRSKRHRGAPFDTDSTKAATARRTPLWRIAMVRLSTDPATKATPNDAEPRARPAARSPLPALHRPRDLRAAHQGTPRTRHHRPATHPPRCRHHPPERRRPPQHVASTH